MHHQQKVINEAGIQFFPKLEQNVQLDGEICKNLQGKNNNKTPILEADKPVILEQAGVFFSEELVFVLIHEHRRGNPSRTLKLFEKLAIFSGENSFGKKSRA